jgi:hypothetical protein
VAGLDRDINLADFQARVKIDTNWLVRSIWCQEPVVFWHGFGPQNHAKSYIGAGHPYP